MTFATKPALLSPLGYQQLTVTTVQTLTVPPGATLAIIDVEAQAVRWRDDGVAPTATIGMPIAVSDLALVYSGNLAALQFIAQVAGGIIDVSYYKVIG